MGDSTIRVTLIQGVVAVVVALIGAASGYLAAQRNQSHAATEKVYAKSNFAPGLRVAPENMSKEECAAAMKQELLSRGIALTVTDDSDAGRRVENGSVLGFWCAKRRVLLYYGVAPDLTEAQRLRRLVRNAADAIGATEAPDE
jgi:hypothetical protein